MYDRVAEVASPTTALGYVERIETFLRGFDLVFERGPQRDDFRFGLRIVGFERLITGAFNVVEDRVVIFGSSRQDAEGKMIFKTFR